MIDEKVLICGVVKNCGNMLEKNIRLAIKTGELFSQYKIIIYENNSTDNTKQILTNYINDERFCIMMEDFTDEELKQKSKIWAFTEITKSNHPCRIEQICNARNKVIDMINEENADYVIWVDLDGSWELSGIVDSFKQTGWDAIYANGIQSNMNYFDQFAFRDMDNLFGPELLGEYWWMKHSNVFKTLQSNTLIPVISAFGGIGIVKANLYKLFKYDCLPTENMKSFYKEILPMIDDHHLKLISNTCPVWKKGIQDGRIIWKANSGYDSPMVCEHVVFNIELFTHNYKIFINPKMIYYY
jgi:glycosyltransferase involved in cell wall biosynthesis